MILHYFSTVISIFVVYMRIIISTILVLHLVVTGFAQDPAKHYDSNYVVSYSRQLTTRIYLSQKYTLFTLEAPKGIREIQYRPNTTVNLGVGATYKSFTLNLAYGFGFLNRDQTKGKTNYLDLQSHIYSLKWRFDFFGQFYKGYYLYPRGFAAGSSTDFYQRPDLRVNEIGFHAYHMYNNRKHSYRSSYVQNEWQQRSAGTFLLGGAIALGNVNADSAFAPSSIGTSYEQNAVKGLRYLELGPGAGYSHTFVYDKHWFLNLSTTLNLNTGFVREFITGPSQTTVRFSPNLLFRTALGYNSEKWNVNFSWVTNRTSIEGKYKNGAYHVNSGNYRFTVARRYEPGPKTKKLLRKLDQLFDRK